ncbi:glycoside hydrolase family 78 protein [Prolixibacter sp. SD074]|uniref:glycoside hydrolase family 78 protein n=1 Tax=Prolixibacter sp. SD074 TaxID=2652391 RepID=UPI001272717A|nr:glycoside hydrolase family 78 protein [Prolixibacter sp. SD074]GET28019.1 alpha-L-rhamnosidase [Prolixibacter sp. SD074]
MKNPRLSWQIQSDRENVLQTAYEIRVADTPANLHRKDDLIWNSGKVESNQSADVVYSGPALTSMQRVYWQVRIWDNRNKATEWSEPAYWEMGLLKPTDWKASWITSSMTEDTTISEPCPYFRKEFSLTKKVKSARIYVTSKGLYQLFLNGKKVSPDLFAPGWTSYNKRLQYQTYDVTSLLEKKNAMGTILGDGWYRGYLTWDRKRNTYGDKLAVLLQLQINYMDGTSETMTTDNTWKEKSGPILSSDIYDGETYDARLKMPGWDKPDFDDSQWNKVSELPDGKDILVAQDGVPVRAADEIKPIKLFKTPKGETVFDLGQNMVGWVRLKVQGYKGDKVILKFAEVLDKDGNFYTANLRKAKATDTYILSGKGVEVYEPHFTFHGFRFVKVEGFPGTPDLNSITGIVIHSDMKPTGNFVCSDSLLNQLQHNIQWGQRGNFLDVPTDCPQRDERLGWTGDAQVFSMTAAFNFNVAAFYTKWLRDLAADQQSNGIVPHVIPDVLHGAGGSAAWADASVIVPWSVYLTYGDKRILEEQYPGMKSWVEYMHGRAGKKNLWLGDAHFGDWLAFATNQSDYPGATTDKDLIATAYYFYSTSLLSKIAGIIGNENDAEQYKKLAGEIRKAFNAEFVTPNGRLESNTQTAYVLALAFHLLPEDKVSKAANYLADDVRKFGHLTTGFVGTPLLCQTLSDNGYPDLAFMLLMNKKYPSWLYPVTQGATTIWERWDGQKPDGTFQDVGMNSFNHYAYGAIGEWMYSYVGGIRIDPKQPGYKHFFLAPHVGGGLSYATTTFQSLYGSVESDWKIQDDNFIYTVTIPANTTATVILPGANSEQLTLNSLPLKSEMKKVVTQQPDGVSMELGSGQYRFHYPYENAKKK